MPGAHRADVSVLQRETALLADKRRIDGQPLSMKPNQRARGRGTWSDQARRVTRTHKSRLRKVRGEGTLNDQVSGLHQVKESKLNARRGSGTWGDQARRLDRQRRQRDRDEKRQGSLLRRLLGAF